MTAVILHLSDIHIKGETDVILTKGDLIASTIFPNLSSATHLFVLCTGDIAYSGGASEYCAAQKLFSAIKNTLQKETNCPIDFIVLPGNHDCNFKNAKSFRKTVIDDLERKDINLVDNDVINELTNIQDEFFSFQSSVETHEPAEEDKLWRTYSFDVEEKKVVFECLNVSWISKLKDEPGRLSFPIERYKSKKNSLSDVRVVAMHHPLNWYSQSTYRSFRTFVRTIGNIVVTGHEHQGNAGINQDIQTDTSIYVEGSVLQESSSSLGASSFNVIVIDLERSQFRFSQYVWNDGIYQENADGSWLDYRDLPSKQVNPFSVCSTFSQMMEDPGAFLHPSGHNLTLSDIFVYPDLRKVGNGEDRRRHYSSATHLLKPEMTQDGVLIEGIEKSGTTSLLYQLFKEYHDRGFVPIFIKGIDVKRVNSDDLDSLIYGNFKDQYSQEGLEQFKQTSKSRKILLLDNFDHSKIRAGSARVKLLHEIKARFGHFVISVSDMFEMREILEGESADGLAALQHFKVQPFGHARREELIKKWWLYGEDGSLDEASFIAKVDSAERLLNSVMQKAVIPSVPLYLLTLLQSVDSPYSGSLKDTGLGEYYRLLITGALQKAGVNADKLTEHYSYCSYLAWEYHRLGKKELSRDELEHFTLLFSKKFTKTDFNERLECLLESRILCMSGQDYSFRYPYMYYFLKGMYLSGKLDDLDCRAYIKRCCEHLYVRENANTILFLAHHSKDRFVFRSISDSLHNLFNEKTPVTFNKDTGSVGNLLNDLPKLKFEGGNPIDHRKQRNESRDEFDDGEDGLLAAEEESDELSLIAKMITLFKTIEILGQVLKNQYSTIERVDKSDLLVELFNGPLRAVRDFYDFCERHPDALIIDVKAVLTRKGKVDASEEEKTEIARRVAASIVQMITYGFINKAAQSVNSENLRDEVEQVVKRVNTPAFKLIELATLLDSPKGIPKSKLSSLFTILKHDLIGSRLIQFMTLNRLYMFKTSEAEMQWINQELGIDLATQHQITYQDKKQRFVN